MDRQARRPAALGVTPQYRLAILGQRRAVRHADGGAVAVEGRTHLEALACMLAARTEQRRMADRSVIAPVERRNAAGEHLDLCMRQGAVLVIEVADLLVFQIQLDIEIEEVENLLRHQA